MGGQRKSRSLHQPVKNGTARMKKDEGKRQKKWGTKGN